MTTLCEFDGCEYRLKDSAGRCLKKPWRVITTLRCLREPLSRLFSASHVHGSTNGADAVASGYYSDELVRVIGETVLGEVAAVTPEEEQGQGDESPDADARADPSEIETRIPSEPMDSGGEDDGLGPSLREPVVVSHPQPPSEAAQAKHNLTHLPYQPWCGICV